MKKRIKGKFRGQDVEFEVKGATLNAPPSWWVIPANPDEPPFPVYTVDVREALDGAEVVFTETETLITEAISEIRNHVGALTSDNIDDAKLAELEALVGTLRASYTDGRQHRRMLDEYGLPAREEEIAGPVRTDVGRNDDV